MNPKILYMSFAESVRSDNHSVSMRLRPLVKDLLDIHIRIPDKSLLDLFRRKLFMEKLEFSSNTTKSVETELIDIFGSDYEDLFRM